MKIRALVGSVRYAHALFAVRPGGKGWVLPSVATAIGVVTSPIEEGVGVEILSERRLDAAKILIRKEPQNSGLL